MQRTLALCELLLRWSSSVALAVLTISGIAAILAIATWYESYYGAAAARAVVYESRFFYAVLFFLALNVAAVVISRYPWKRKHTGFIVTHVGIEILLLGCLLDIRLSQEGRVALRPGQSIETIDSIRDGIFVSWRSGVSGDSRGRTEAIPMDNRWTDAGFPSIGRFLASPVLGLPRAAWPAGQVWTHAVAPGVTLEVLDWTPAAKPTTKLMPAADGAPAAELSLAGQTPAGAAVDDKLLLHGHDDAGVSGTLFGGVIEASLWRARAPEEATRFLDPVDLAALPAAGIVNVLVDGKWHAIDVAAQAGKTVALPDGKTGVAVDGYFPAARWDGQRLASDGERAADPMVQLTMTRATDKVQVVVAARAPYLSGPLVAVPKAFGPVPVVVYDHPSMLRTDPAGVRGRLELLATDDGRLLYRRCGLRGVENLGELKRGDAVPAWMGLSLKLTQFEPHGRAEASFVAADVAPKDLSDSMRAARVALVVDGNREAFAIARAGPARTVKTARGDFAVQYAFDAIDLPASLTLKAARMGRDPGTDRAASYESDVAVQPTAGKAFEQRITMNEPLTVAGRTFYQSGFDEGAANGPVSVLSMRYDPGRPVKYAGCAGIVLGIFLMFYMKSYFQRPATARAPAEARADVPAIAPIGVQA